MLSELYILVSSPHFCPKNQPTLCGKPGFSAVVLGSRDQKVDSPFDPQVAVAEIIELGGNVVRKIVPLKLPDREKVGLELRDLVERGGEVVPVFLLLVLVRFLPQDVRRDAAESESGNFIDSLAGSISPEIGLSQIVFAAKLGENAPTDCPLGTRRSGMSQDVQRDQQGDDQPAVDHLAEK
jgi:hypothetical protein